MRSRIVVPMLCVLAGVATTAHAGLFTATDNSASANITSTASGPNTNVTIVLSNLTPAASTGSAGNLLTGIDFGSTDISGFTLQSQTGAQQMTLSTDKAGALDTGGPFDPTWAIVTSPFKALYFNGFGTGGEPMIGPAIGNTSYPNGNPSLVAGPHGTYIYETATFTLQIAGAFDASSITSVDFRFNTDGLTIVPGDPNGGSGTPEPASLGLLGLGALSLLARRRR